MTIPKVSVIIPTRNRAGLLPTAIRSVLQQTFRDFELIVVDDASDDNINNAVTAFDDPRIKYVRHHFHKGGSAARNTGIASSKAEYIALLDDDDEWLLDKLTKQVNLFLASPTKVGCIYTGYLMVDRSTGRINGHILPEKKGDLSNDLLFGNPLGAGGSSVLLKRECFNRIGMFDETLPSFQDYDFWIRISREFHFDYINEPLVKYYTHSNTIWTNPEAIRKGIDILVRKYGTSETFRKTCSESYLSVAVQFCESGNSRKARETLRRAISLYPFDARHYFYYFLSLLNQGMYQRVQESKAKVLGSLAGASRNGVWGR